MPVDTLQVNPDILISREGTVKEKLSTGSVYIKNKELYLFLGSESVALGIKPGMKIATPSEKEGVYNLIDKGGAYCTIISQIENLKDYYNNLTDIDEDTIKEDPQVAAGIDMDIRGYRRKIMSLKQRLNEIMKGRLIDRF